MAKRIATEQYTCDQRTDVSGKEGNNQEENKDQTPGFNAEERSPRRRPQQL
jgi:hypothetical protein